MDLVTTFGLLVAAVVDSPVQMEYCEQEEFSITIRILSQHVRSHVLFWYSQQPQDFIGAVFTEMVSCRRHQPKSGEIMQIQHQIDSIVNPVFGKQTDDAGDRHRG